MVKVEKTAKLTYLIWQ